jgi:hypothetical protein
VATDPSRIILRSGGGVGHSVRTTQVHHRDFPEVSAEGESPLRAADRLVLLLDRALDSAPSPWHRQGIEQAKADVWSYIGNRLTMGL